MGREFQRSAEGLRIRADIYNAFHVVFGSELSDEAVSVLSGSALADAAEMLFDGEVAKGVSGVSRALASLDEDGDGITLADCYTRLFVGPNPPEAAPWESVYNKEDGYLFGPTTLAVRKCYVAAGFTPQNYPHVADDHLALELDFMKSLGFRATKAAKAGDDACVREALEASRRFLEDHLLKWIEPFATCLGKSPYGKVYLAAAESLKVFLEADKALLEDLLAELKGVEG